jgi:MerR family transcriptional regulator, light-induced transcriptional regulator
MVLYSINDLEKITGIKAHTIRIWEKRYNVVSPGRTSTNIRYYKDGDLKKLLNISTLNRHGFRISHIISMPAEEINEKILEISSKSNDFESQINSLIVAMIEINEESFEKILSKATLKLGFEKVISQILFPLLEKIGVLWQIGTITPVHEHFVSNIIRQKIISAIDAQSHMVKSDSKTFILFLPENELHELGLLFYNYLLKKKGFKVIYLGQNVPFSDLLEMKKVKNAEYLFTYFMAAMPTEEIPAYLQKLSDKFPLKTIFISGQQLKQVNSNLPQNISVVKNPLDFKETIQNLS